MTEGTMIRTTGSPWRTSGPSWPGCAPLLALIAAGVAVFKLVPEFGVAGGRRAIGMVLVGLGILVSTGGTRRWRQVQAAMAHGDDLPRTRMPLLLGSALALLAIAVAVLLLVAP